MKNLILYVSLFYIVGIGYIQNAWSFEVSYPSYRESVVRELIGGNSFFYGTTNNKGFVQYKFDISYDSVYELSALVVAKDSQSNSFWVQIDDEEPIQWSLETSGYEKWRTFKKNLFFTKGSHEITFLVDEPNTKIADIRINDLIEILESTYPSAKKGVQSFKENGNTYFYGDTSNEGYIEYEFLINEPGYYDLKALIISKDGKSDSFKVQTSPLFRKTWHIGVYPSPTWRTYGEVFLEKGLQVVKFHVRESETMISDASLVKSKYQQVVVQEDGRDLLSRGFITFNGQSGAYTIEKFKEDFINGSGYSSSEAGRCNIDENGVLSVDILKDKLASEGGVVANPSIASGSEYLLAYDVKFASDFEWAEGGKVLGLLGGDQNTGGDMATDGKGWSARVVWSANGRIKPYIYHKDQTSQYGEKLGATDYYINKNEWTNVKIYVKVNTGEDANGILKISINNEIILDVRDLRFATESGKHNVNGIAFNAFRGGQSEEHKSSTDSKILFDNILVQRLQ